MTPVRALNDANLRTFSGVSVNRSWGSASILARPSTEVFFSPVISR